jgi:nicotinic acid mononucleotide adenylyltransferase
MRLIVPPAVEPRKLGLLPGSFNPPTRAHLALADAALNEVDEVLLVLPGILPHKAWEGATLEQRTGMLSLITSSRARVGAAVSEGGLFAEIAREARALYADAEIYIVCGRDAAERIVGWDYGEPDAIMRQLQEFRLLVAPRAGCYDAPPNLAHAIQPLPLATYDEFASSRVRERSAGWRDLVPEEIAHLVESIY